MRITSFLLNLTLIYIYIIKQCNNKLFITFFYRVEILKSLNKNKQKNSRDFSRDYFTVVKLVHSEVIDLPEQASPLLIDLRYYSL